VSAAKTIYLTTNNTNIVVGMTIKNNAGTSFGTVSTTATSGLGGCAGSLRKVTVASNVTIPINTTLNFQAPGTTPVVTGKVYNAIVSVNNTGDLPLTAMTFTHSQSATTLETCTGTYTANTCSAGASAVTPGSSHSVAIAAGGQVRMKVTLSVNDLVTTINDALSVSVARSQVRSGITTTS